MGNPNVAIGHVETRYGDGGRVKISIAMDSATFAEVRGRAILAGHSFAEEARTLIEWGLEADNGTA